jgi:hypothetical protein
MKKMPDLQKCVTRLKTTIIQVVRSHVVIKKNTLQKPALKLYVNFLRQKQ